MGDIFFKKSSKNSPNCALDLSYFLVLSIGTKAMVNVFYSYQPTSRYVPWWDSISRPKVLVTSVDSVCTNRPPRQSEALLVIVS
jgi:hypothetical protein